MRQTDQVGRACAAAILAAALTSAAACGHPRSAPRAQTPAARMQLELRCDEADRTVTCQALASDDQASNAAIRRDVTDAVVWTADTDAVVVAGGRIRAERGGAATVTATWTGMPGPPSASVTILADAKTRAARQTYAIEGEVRRFPTADGVSGAHVTLIGDHGVEQTVTTSSQLGALGQFRFLAVSSGTYRLRAVRDGYRETETTVVVPDEAPRTITLLPEPRAHS